LFEIQVNSHFTSLALTSNYALALNYLRYNDLTHIPLMDSGIIIGLILGALLIYSFGSVVLLCIQEVTPLLYLDIKAQQEEGLA
jgi:Na+/H+-translocating membrane pyrophosphatase